VFISGGQYLATGNVIIMRGPSAGTLPVRVLPGEASAIELGRLVLESFTEFKQSEATHWRQLPNVQDEILRLGGYKSDIAFRRETMLVMVTVIDDESARANAFMTEKKGGVGGFRGIKESEIVVATDAESLGQGVLDTMLLSRLEDLTPEQSMAKIRPESLLQQAAPSASLYFSGGRFLAAGNVQLKNGTPVMTLPIRTLPDDATNTQLGQTGLDSFADFKQVDATAKDQLPDAYTELKQLGGHKSDAAFRRETLMIRLQTGRDQTVHLTATITETKPRTRTGFINIEELDTRPTLQPEPLGQAIRDTLHLCRLRGFTPQETATKLNLPT